MGEGQEGHHYTLVCSVRDEEIIQVEDMYYTVEPLYNEHPLGNKVFGLYTEVGFVERLFCTQTAYLGPGLDLYHSWPFFRL